MENKSFKFIDPSSLPRSVDPYYFLKTLQGHFEEAERKKLVPQVWTENYPQVMQAYAALLKDLKKISPSKHEQFHPTTIRMVVADMRDTKVKRQIETWIEQNGKFLCRTYLLPSFFMKGALCTNETMQAVQDLKHTMSLSDYGFFLISTRGHEEEVDAFALGYLIRYLTRTKKAFSSPLFLCECTQISRRPSFRSSRTRNGRMGQETKLLLDRNQCCSSERSTFLVQSRISNSPN